MIFDYSYVVSSRFADAYKPETCNPSDGKSEEWRHMQRFPPPYNDKIVLLIWITFPIAFPQRESRSDSIGTLQIGYEVRSQIGYSVIKKETFQLKVSISLETETDMT